MCTRSAALGIALLVVTLNVRADGDAPPRISRFAGEYVRTTVDEKSQAKAANEYYLVGVGEADYEVTVPTAGWYELYIQACGWPTNLYLDGEFVIHSGFDSGVWEPGDLVRDGRWAKGPNGAKKALNLYLTAGDHMIRFRRDWFPGLPWMRGFYLQPATDITGRARLTLVKDYLAFRRGEQFPVCVTVGGGDRAETVTLRFVDVAKEAIVGEWVGQIPAGTGNVELKYNLPTDTAGTFDVQVLAADGRHVDRTLQYCVVDTSKPSFPAELRLEVVEEIDPTTREPDYARGPTRVVTTPLGSYRESGDVGREGGTGEASWFAYTLDLSDVQVDYLMRIEFPDDDQREVPIVLVERDSHPMPAQGYSTGGVYPLSGTMQTQDFYFTARDADARVLFYNWNTGQRAAVARITVYRLTGGFPTLNYGMGGRLYGMYQEEPMRYLNNFGARMGSPDANEWLNFQQATERVGQRCNYAGINLWFPTIAIYGNTLWPSEAVPGFQIGILPPGPPTAKEPLRKDVMRLMLLTSEAYGLNFIGDLDLPNVYLDSRFADPAPDNPLKPWITVSRTGEPGVRSATAPYYTVAHPGVQDWAAEVFQELADRYGKMPAFKGLRIRLMVGWAFDGWQCFRSLDWGYEDSTIQRFAADTGIDIPVAADDPQRFRKRYDFLVREHYEDWVGWRCRQVYAYHSRLAAILTAARPDLKLILNPPGTDVDEWREYGIDPALCAANPAIILTAGRGYPDAGNRHPDQPLSAAEKRDKNWTAAPLRLVDRPVGDGTVAALEFGTNHEGPYAQPEEVGYEPKRRNSVVYPDATLNPAGVLYLERFANAMADGNITFMHDGSHGYVIGQPHYLRPWLAEYRALPPVGMKPLGDTDPAVLWYGRDDTRAYFYVVSRANYPVEATVTFTGRPQVERLGTATPLPTVGERLALTLQPFELVACGNDRESTPTALAVTAPATARREVGAQLAFINRLLDRQPAALEVVALSPEELLHAREHLAAATRDLAAGHTWRAHIELIHSDMIRLYEAFQAYPPGLMNRKTFSLPPGRVSPADLAKVLTDPAAAEVAAGPAGDPMLLLGPKPATLVLTVPFTGRYRVRCAFVVGDGFATPLLGNAAGPLPILGEQLGTQGGQVVSTPVVLRQGECRLTLVGAAGILGIYLEPVYRDLTTADFRAIGPFHGFDGWMTAKGVYAKMDETCFPEDGVDLAATREVDGRNLSWVAPQAGTQVHDSQAPNYICLFSTFGTKSVGGKGWISYAHTRIESPEARAAQLNLGADYWAKIWVNGEVVFRPDQRPNGPPVKGESQFPIQLRQGANDILVKLHAGSNGNGLWLSITDPGDLEYPGDPRQ